MNVKIDNLNINYLVKGEGPVILLLHGWGCTKEIFNNMINHLALNNKVYGLDLPGFGKSDEPLTPWGVDEYADLVIKFIEKFNLKKISLLGHSNGGRIIIKILNRNTNFVVDRAILMDSAGIKNKMSSSKSFKTKIIKLFKKFVFNNFTNKLFPSLLNKLKSKFGSEDYRNASPMMRSILVKIVNEDLTDYLPNIKIPILLIWGEMDTATPLEDAYKMEKLIPNAGLVVLKGRSHYAFLEEPQTINIVLDSFLKGSNKSW